MNSTAMRALIGFLVAPAVPALALYFVNVNGEAAPLIFFVLAPSERVNEFETPGVMRLQSKWV
jgi:hypothetical protein